MHAMSSTSFQSAVSESQDDTAACQIIWLDLSTRIEAAWQCCLNMIGQCRPPHISLFSLTLRFLSSVSSYDAESTICVWLNLSPRHPPRFRPAY